MIYYHQFQRAIRDIENMMKNEGVLVPPTFWQGADVRDKPEMGTYEMQNVCFSVNTSQLTHDELVEQIGPDMPWAEDHFQERVGGEPLNPGEQWKHWPYAHKADTFRDEHGQFNHNYMERLWPRWAGKTSDGSLESWNWDNAAPQTYNSERDDVTIHTPNRGIRHAFGDLYDVVDLFMRDPLTRQAFIPIFFPEDTGAHHEGRVPCTLGYHIIRRSNRLHINYFIRSCDLLRHFRDDIYLTVRLNQWLLDQLKARDPKNWEDVLPGVFTMFITSLHMFRNDWQTMFNEPPPSYTGAINEYHAGIGNGPSTDSYYGPGPDADSAAD